MRRNFFLYFVLTFIVGATTFGLVSAHREDVQKKKRTEELRQLAETLGFVFDEVPTGLRTRFGAFDAFGGRNEHYGRNTITGFLAGQFVVVTDHVIVYQSARRTNVERVQTLAFFPQGATGLPNFVLFPGPDRKSADDKTTPHIAFAKTDKFAQTYAVLGTDERAIQGVFGPKTRAFFSAEQGWTVEIHDGAGIVYRSRTLIAPAEVSAFLTDARKVLDAFRLR